MKVLRVICRCSQTTKSNLGPLGYLFVALPPEHYARFTNVPYVQPNPTPDLPTFSDDQTDGQREQAKLNWQAHRAENANIANMNEALTNLFLEAIPDAYKKNWDNDLVGRTNAIFWPIFKAYLDKYGRIKPMDLELNLQRMKAEWDPSTPIEDLFAQIKNAHEYSIFAGHPYDDKALVNAGELTILRTGEFPQEYKDWRSLMPKDRTWAQFQEYWQDAYDLKEETETTAASLGYGGNATDLPVPDDNGIYESTVNNFGTAFAANSAAFEQLTESNKTLGSEVAANVSGLQAQINALTTMMQNMAAGATNAPNAPTQPPQPTPPHAVQPPPPQPIYPQYYQQPPPPQMHPPPTYNMYQPAYQVPQTYGRGGRGGRGRRTNRYGQGQAYQMPPMYGQYSTPQQTPAQYPTMTPNTRAYNPPYSNTRKRHANMNYCWTHGHDVPANHTSQNCTHPAPGHIWTANRQNTCGGSTKHAHKTTMPTYNSGANA